MMWLKMPIEPYMLSTGKDSPAIENDNMPKSDTMLNDSRRLGTMQHTVSANAWQATISNVIAVIIVNALQLSGKWA